MPELKCDLGYDDLSPRKDDSTSETDSDCSSCSPPSSSQSSPQSYSSLSCDEENKDRRSSNKATVLDEEEPHYRRNRPRDHSAMNMSYSYAPQHDTNNVRVHRTKIRDIMEDEVDSHCYRESFRQMTLPRTIKKSNNLILPNRFIAALVAVASVSLILSALILSMYSPMMQYSAHPIDEKQLILQDVFSQEVTDEQFTIRISVNHGRLDLLMNSIDSHSACSRVKQIQVDWQQMLVSDPPNSIVDHFSHKVVIIKNSVQSSSDITSLSTNAVLLLSDDVVLTCNELDRAFYIWKQHPDRMVGFFPYHYKEQADSILSRLLMYIPKISKAPYKLMDVNDDLRSYSLLSDRASFIHRLYLRTTLDLWMLSSPCRSIALSLKITSISKKPPMIVASRPLQLQTSATMSKIYNKSHTQWLESSSTCFSSIMKYLQLKDLPNEHRQFIGNVR